MSTDTTQNIFSHGTAWVKADFHLHTRADKEFLYSGDDDRYMTEYIENLEKQNVCIGVITNHNKFRLDEFKNLRKKAKKKEIFLFPGVELCIGDGANGIHTLIVFSEEWINTHDHINPFLTTAFTGQSPQEYENGNGKSTQNILETLKTLEGFQKDYFIIFAHVENSSGLWNELDGGRLQHLGKNELFRKRTLGFQKVRTRDERNKIQSHLKWYPAEVEGSDPKNMIEAGNFQKTVSAESKSSTAHECYLKVGAGTFEAVKYALLDKENRVSCVPPSISRSYIEAVRLTGGNFDGQEIPLSQELNTFIGIRGSGKSSLIETLRYTLGIPFGSNTSDQEYKNRLVNFTLGSGGKVEIDAINRFGQKYTIRRINGAQAEVLIDQELQSGISICETVLYKPIYFGQKDLANTGAGFGYDFVNKLLGTKLDEIRKQIQTQKQKAQEAVITLEKISTNKQKLVEFIEELKDINHKLKFYDEHGVKDKLQKRLDYESDIRVLKNSLSALEAFTKNIIQCLSDNEDNIRNLKSYESKYNAELFKIFYEKVDYYIQFIDTLKQWTIDEPTHKAVINNCENVLQDNRKNMMEEFSEIERQLAKELKEQHVQNISSEEFLSLTKNKEKNTKSIAALEKETSVHDACRDKMLKEASLLNELWHKEYTLIKNELSKLTLANTSISIQIDYKADKKEFIGKFKDILRGSGIREVTFEKICNEYQDFIEIYKDIEKAKELFGANPHIIYDAIMKNLKELLVYKVPNNFIIMYQGKELEKHSLGQRASALILFVLSQNENDLIMIDQPEDDLDNQTIYNDVIKLICKMKPNTQFIFATHNPNIPVLGDAELVHTFKFDDSMNIYSESIDNEKSQKAIVEIMEGGEEAFKKRKEIYQAWKS